MAQRILEQRTLPLEAAVYRAVLYADIFDFPLTRAEILTFLPAVESSAPETGEAIDQALAAGYLETDGVFIYRAGRSETVALRRRRAAMAAGVWPIARFHGRLIWAIPFVRMVAVTGALSVDNVDPGDDIDFLVVTEPGRLWLTRGLIVLLCKMARLRGRRLCPNYLITTRALALGPGDLYAAHELAQMVMLHGQECSRQLWLENLWYLDHLPNAQPHWGVAGDALPRSLRLLKRVGEAILRSPVGGHLERWERERKIAKLQRQVWAGRDESVFTSDVCKGHLDGHARRVRKAFAARLADGAMSRELKET